MKTICALMTIFWFSLNCGSLVLGAGKALLVGVEEYSNPTYNIPGTREDVRLLSEALATTGAFPQEDIKTLVDGNASKANILQVFREHLIDGAKSGDTVFLYFNGHSARIWDQGALRNALVPWDGDTTKQGEQRREGDRTCFAFAPEATINWILEDELLEMTKQLKGRNIIFVIDDGMTPLSDFLQRFQAKTTRSFRRNSDKRNEGPEEGNLAILAAGTGGPAESATFHEPPKGQHSVFTWFFLKGLYGQADLNRDGRVTLGELAKFVEGEVNGAGYAQTPQHMFSQELFENFPLVRINKSEASSVDGASPGSAALNEAYQSLTRPKPVTLKDSALKPEETLICLDTSQNGISIKLIREKRIVGTYYVEWKLEDLEKDIRNFRQAFEEFKLKEFSPGLGKLLYARLMSKVLSDVPRGTPIIIIPDGVLSVLPFEALVVSGEEEWKEGSFGPYPDGLTYLRDVYPISYSQSISAINLARTAGTATKKGDRILVIADPIFDSSDGRIKAVPPLNLELDKLMSLKVGTGLDLPRLPLTARIGDSVSKLYPGKTDVFTGDNAVKSLLFDKSLADYRFIVIATHGYCGDDFPGIQEPFLVFTSVNQPNDRDAFLRVSEVLGLRLSADLVWLVASQSGLGRNIEGQGVMSIGRAFQHAGAKSVLMSLWSVSESASVNLVESFFKYLKEGKNKLEALKLAREEIRKAGYDHPFYWAPFILVGEVN